MVACICWWVQSSAINKSIYFYGATIIVLMASANGTPNLIRIKGQVKPESPIRSAEKSMGGEGRGGVGQAKQVRQI